MLKRIMLFVFISMLGFVVLTGNSYADLTSGLVAYYPFNGNTNDESGNGNNGTVYGATLTTNRFGKENSAYSFDGTSNNYIDVTVPNINTTINNKITISFWMNWDANGSGYGSMPISFDLYDLLLYKGGFGFNTSRGDVFGISNNNNLLNRWVYVAAIFNNGQITLNSLYINGAKQNLTQVFNNPITKTVSTDIRIGGWRYDNFWPFSGSIDDIRIYNRNLSESEIQQLYQQEDARNSLSASIDRMTSQSGSITCTNWTTGNAKILKIIKGVTQWDCEKAGLIVNKGDKIQIKATVNGIAK